VVCEIGCLSLARAHEGRAVTESQVTSRIRIGVWLEYMLAEPFPSRMGRGGTEQSHQGWISAHDLQKLTWASASHGAWSMGTPMRVRSLLHSSVWTFVTLVVRLDICSVFRIQGVRFTIRV